MAKTIQVSVDTSDLKVLNTHLSTTKKTIKMTATSAKTDFKSLKMAIDPVYRAEKLFTQQILIAQKAVATGAIDNREYARTFAMIQKNAKASGMTLNQFGQVAHVNTRKMKRFGAVGMQQVGYQVQDLAVQLQGGTDALVAIGQQGSQLLGIFGPAGAIAGAILAIGTGLAGAFLKAKHAAEGTINVMKTYKETIDEVRATTKGLKVENFGLALSIESMSEAGVKYALKRIKDVKAEKEALNKEKIADNKRQGQGPGLFKADLGDTPAGGMFAFMGIGKTYNEIIAELEKELVEVMKEEKFNKEMKDQKEVTLLAKGYKDARETAEDLIGASERQLLIRTQDHALVAKSLEMQKLGFGVGDKLHDQAVRDLEAVNAINLAKFDQLQAEQALIGAGKIAQESERKRLRLAKAAHDAAKLAAADLINLNKAIGSSMDTALMGIVDGTKSVKDAFKDMAREIIKELYRIYVVKKITGMITGAIEGKFAPDIGATANPHTLANGGSAMAGQRYIVGERGPEVFTPSVSGHVTPNSGGGGGSGTTIVQNINVSTGVQQTVRAEIRQMMPQIADSAKGAVLDAKRRGGSYGRAMA